MATVTPKVGQTVETQDGRHGLIRYSGPLHIAAGDWLGLELPDDSGKNDGSVKGERYFQCPPRYGIFVRKESIIKIVKQPAPTQRPNGATPTANGSTTKPRPSGVMPADVARKRQSLMGGGSGSTVGSRLSIRSPAKSPSKAVSSASSAASTPRTGTPATTARTSDSSTKSRLSTTGRASMAPPPAPTKTTTPGPRPSMGAAAVRANTKPVPSPTRQSLSGSRMSLGSRSVVSQSRRTARPAHDEDVVKSPTIDEEEREDDVQSVESRGQGQEEPDPNAQEPAAPQPSSPDQARPRTISISRSTAASVESRTAEKREIEQLKAKLRTLDKKLLENRDRLKAVDALQEEKDRYEIIIQTLQKKIKAHQQDMADIKSKLEEAENRAGEGQGRSAEHESEIELASLDKEMAEERAEMYHAELEALKIRHEELELEADILREENRELGSVMSPEEKANAGWMVMEKEQERLRQALILLRDMSQTNESQLKSEIKELQETLDEMETTASKYTEVVEKLARTEETNKHLMDQLEVAEANDDVVIAMDTQREQSMTTIERLQKQIQELEEHIQVTDELESFHLDEEKRLHYQLDESEALLSEKHRHTQDQEKAIEDLEYTLNKFRDVVQGLQSDINELRRSRDISDLQAHEMSSKSRAIMDLNLQLQSSASKSQLKTIDFEMGKMHAEQARSHLDILQLFVPESFEADRNPILALLCFKRIRSKAALTKSLLAERVRDRPHLTQDEPFVVFEVMEKLNLIAAFCDRSIQFMSTCSPEEFSKYSGALYELEPVERSMTGWIEALKRDELCNDGPDFLQRMIDIIQDIAEKLITESDESKGTELVAQISAVESYADSAANQLSTIVRAVQDRLGNATDEDEESQVFDKKMDQFGTKARTIKYLSSKVTQLLLDLRSGSMCLGETTWAFFEEAETTAAKIAAMIRHIGKSVVAEIARFDFEEPPSYTLIIKLMTAAAETALHEQDPRATMADDAFALLASLLQSLQSKVDDLQSKAGDIASATEFESHPSPWTVRAKQIKAQKVFDRDTQEELTKLKTRAQEQILLLATKEKILEEHKIRVELLESRSKEGKKREKDVDALGAVVERLEGEKRDLEGRLEEITASYDEVLLKWDHGRQELEKIKAARITGGRGVVVTGLGANDESTQHLRVEMEMLKTEILSLQSAVRYLKSENQGLRVPVGEVALLAERNAWLAPEALSRKMTLVNDRMREREKLKREGEDVLDQLIHLAGTVRPVRLKTRDPVEGKRGEGSKGWHRMQQSTRWQVAKQREEMEQWVQMREEVVRKGRVETRLKVKTKHKGNEIQSQSQSPGILGDSLTVHPSIGDEVGAGMGKGVSAGRGKQVRIVES